MSGSFGAAVNGNYPAQNGMGYNAATGAYELGGDLTRPTIINTDLVNLLKITGLQAGDPSTDSLAVIGPDGTIKFILVAGLPDFWRQVGTGSSPDGTTDTDDGIRHLGSVGIGGAATTDAMPTVTTPVAVNSYLHLSHNAAHRAQVMYGGSPVLYYLERNLPTVVNNYIDIGSWTSGAQASVFTVAVNVSSGAFAASKYYAAALDWHATAGAWRVLRPLSDGGAFNGNNYELLANVNNGVVGLRLRRTAGATVGIAKVYLQVYNDPATMALTESQAQGADATVYAILDPNGSDFWRSNAGTILPDGTTDTSDTIGRLGAVVVGSNAQVGTSQLSVVSDTNNVTDPIISAQANNLTQGVDILWAGIQKSGTSANSDMSVNAKGTGNLILHASAGGEPASTGRTGIGTNAPSAWVQVNKANGNAGAGVCLLKLVDTNIANSYLAVDNGQAANAYRLISTIGWELQAAGNNNQIFLAANGGVGFGTNAPTAGNGVISAAVNGLKPGGGAWGAFSDRRVKEDIKPVTYGLAELARLIPVTFKYNGKAGTLADGRTHYSLIAQDVMEVIPDFVEEIPISDETFESMEAKDQESFKDRMVLGLKEGLTNFEAILINAIKELAEQNKSLMARVAALEGK